MNEEDNWDYEVLPQDVVFWYYLNDCNNAEWEDIAHYMMERLNIYDQE